MFSHFKDVVEQFGLSSDERAQLSAILLACGDAQRQANFAMEYMETEPKTTEVLAMDSFIRDRALREHSSQAQKRSNELNLMLDETTDKVKNAFQKIMALSLSETAESSS